MKRDPQIQFRSIDEIKSFQEEALRQAMVYLGERSPFYKRIFKENGIEPTRIKSLEDLKLLPTTCKADVQKFNNDFLCVPKNQVLDYVTTSGTLGEPVTFMLTENDLDRLAYNDFISFTVAGCTSEDVIQLMTTIDRRFMAGMAYFLGARKLGAGIIRVGNGIPELQWSSILHEKPSTCIVVPSFLIKLAEFAEQHGIDYKNTSLKRAVCIGEPLRNIDLTDSTLTEKIFQKWPNLSLHSTYASTEMQSSFTECSHYCGVHHQPDLIIVELLDEKDNEVLPGEVGELVITTLGIEGMPLLRFKTGDLCHAITDPCSCGRNSMRLSPIVGRKGQMIKYKGTTLYPNSINAVLDTLPGVKEYYVTATTDYDLSDVVKIYVAAGDDSCSAEMVMDKLQAHLRVRPEVVIVSDEQVKSKVYAGNPRKLTRFWDERSSL